MKGPFITEGAKIVRVDYTPRYERDIAMFERAARNGDAEAAQIMAHHYGEYYRLGALGRPVKAHNKVRDPQKERYWSEFALRLREGGSAAEAQSWAERVPSGQPDDPRRMR